MKKIIYAVSFLFLIFNHANASLLTCLSINDIQQGNFNTWLLLYKDSEELASLADTEKFKAHVKQFELAAWDKTYLESGHCFYQGDDPVINRITFAHDAFRPTQGESWHWVKPQSRAECSLMEPKGCQFYS